jgi:hypothetical protein
VCHPSWLKDLRQGTISLLLSCEHLTGLWVRRQVSKGPSGTGSKQTPFLPPPPSPLGVRGCTRL